MDEKQVSNVYFVNLVMMLATAAWQQMGKIPNPLNNKIEKDLNGAQITIEMLLMLRDKTSHNLTPEEDKLVNTTIGDLQMNYADEAGKSSVTLEKKN
jgi:hypothetical protein